MPLKKDEKDLAPVQRLPGTKGFTLPIALRGGSWHCSTSWREERLNQESRRKQIIKKNHGKGDWFQLVPQKLRARAWGGWGDLGHQ